MNENQLLKTMESTGITTWSFDEINLALDNLLEKYKGKVYTEESYKSAKSDKQELNAINKRIEEKRKEYKKICLAPYNAIEDEIKALTKKINEQISEIDEAQVVVNNGRALVAVRFDAQYSAGLDDRMKQQITETVQKVDDTLKDVEITDDDTLYGQIKGLGERVANVTGLDELADDFGDLWDRIVGR